MVVGCVVLHPAASAEAVLGARRRMADAAPLDLPHDSEDVISVALDWASVARVVHPPPHPPPLVPSPFAYLPSSPQELLTAYLEVVGVRPTDCWSAQCTVTGLGALHAGGALSLETGPRQPCADGTDRRRVHGCELVLVTYRDRPEYAAGRERWEAYQREVLQAHLERGVELRPVVPAGWAPDRFRALRAVAAAVEAVQRFAGWSGEETPPRYRYCAPGESPADRPG